MKIPKKALFFIFVAFFGFMGMHLKSIEGHHARGGPNRMYAHPDRMKKINNVDVYKRLNELVPEDYTIFNCKEPIEAMFYSDRTVYFWDNRRAV